MMREKSAAKTAPRNESPKERGVMFEDTALMNPMMGGDTRGVIHDAQRRNVMRVTAAEKD